MPAEVPTGGAPILAECGRGSDAATVIQRCVVAGATSESDT
jgi:hypothetical protein